MTTRYFFLFLLVSLRSAALSDLPTHRFKHLGIDQGLSQSMITAICQDYKGFMWFGTRDGLNRYDGYDFKIYKADNYQKDALTDNHITSIYEDNRQQLWIGTLHGGLLVYSRAKDSFIRINSQAFPPEARYVSTITGHGDRIFISFLSGHVIQISTSRNEAVTNQHYLPAVRVLTRLTPGETQGIFCISSSPDGTVWLNGAKGFTAYNRSGHPLHTSFKSYPTYVVDYREGSPLSPVRNDKLSPLHNDIYKIKTDLDQQHWMTSSLGLYHFNPKKKEFILYRFDDSVVSLLPVTDRAGRKRVWMSTHRRGLGVFHPETRTASFHSYSKLGGAEFRDMLLSIMYLGRDENIWLGTNGRGLLMYSENLSLFKTGRLATESSAENPGRSIYALFSSKSRTGESILYSSLRALVQVNQDGIETSGQSIAAGLASRSITQDGKGNIWFGNKQGLFRYDIRKRTAKQMLHNDGDMVISIYAESTSLIWYTTYSALCTFNPVTGARERFPFSPELSSRLESLFYSSIQPDPDGTLWIGTTNGLYHFDPAQRKFLRVFRNNTADRNSLSASEIKSVLPDPAHPGKFLWVGTTMGLNLLDKSSGTFSRFTTLDGLPNNTIYGILPDNEGNLWLSTNQGISVMNRDTRTFMNFDVHNGLQSNEFNTGAYFKSSDGEMFFGGINGYNRFYPKEILIREKHLPITVSEVRLLNQDGAHPFRFSEDTPNRLAHDQNNINLTLTVPNYTSPGKTRYAYRIVNRDTAWIELGKSRTVTLTNLSPGSYVFQARGTNGSGKWDEGLVTMTFQISPPWWSSLPAQAAYLMISAGFLYWFWLRYKKRTTARQQLEIERQKAFAIIELDKAKSRFLANITHEFRTPLTLINGHIERLKSGRHSEPPLQQYAEMERNSHQLLRLINQLMDLTRLESGKFPVRYEKRDLLSDLRDNVFAFKGIAGQNNIRLTLEIEADSELYLSENQVYIDENIFTTIISNLLSNALKFTDSGGWIKVYAGFDVRTRHLTVRVSDNGPGIPPDELHRIFDRFYQSDSTTVRGHAGSGIGLSLVKELVTLQRGSVAIESKPGSGCIFTVVLSEGPQSTDDGITVQTDDHLPQREEGLTYRDTADSRQDIPLLLLVEDHADLRKFIRESLGDGYRFAEATNGADGLQAAIQLIPDLIISDVMMPGTDGLEFCQLLKNAELTSHIPIMMLTARATRDDRLSALETGADDYLTKPFSTQELSIRVRKLLNSRWLLLRNAGRKEPTQTLPTAEQVFLEKMTGVICEHLRDPAFGVEQLAGLTHMSTSQLHRKIKAITGMPPVLLIKDCRMRRAIELLRAGQENISGVAFLIGFDDPGYFTKVFKKHFGFLPSDRDRLTSAAIHRPFTDTSAS